MTGAILGTTVMGPLLELMITGTLGITVMALTLEHTMGAIPGTTLMDLTHGHTMEGIHGTIMTDRALEHMTGAILGTTVMAQAQEPMMEVIPGTTRPNKMFESSICYFVMLLGLTLAGCEDKDRYQYDKGYEAGREGTTKPSSFLSNREFNQGYEQDTSDAHMYDEGYDDGFDGHKPRFTEDFEYMDGFKDGKRERKEKL